MNKHNKILLEANRKIVQSTRRTSGDLMEKSMRTVNRLTHPPKRVNRIGSMIGGSIGVGLILYGATGYITGRGLWASGSLVAGALTISSNLINLKKIEG